MLKKIKILVFALVAVVGTWAHAAEEDDVPNGQAEISPGDVVEVVSDRAKYKLGREVVATLEKGSQLEVKWVEDGWIGGQQSIDGAERIGWIRREDVKRISTARPEKLPPASPETKVLPETKVTSAAIPQPRVVDEPVVKTPTARQAGFFRVARDAYIGNGGCTIEIVMARNAQDLEEIDPSEKIGKMILVGKGVTNTTLKNVRGLHVRLLTIDNARVTNSGLQYLKDVEGLRVLRLWSPEFGDSALARVKYLANLEALDLEGADISGAGLRHLKSLQKLRALVLGPGIEDGDLRLLEDVVSLEELDLRSCRHITDADLAHLEGLSNLQRIACPPQITNEAKRTLGEKLPNCDFFR